MYHLDDWLQQIHLLVDYVIMHNCTYHDISKASGVISLQVSIEFLPTVPPIQYFCQLSCIT